MLYPQRLPEFHRLLPSDRLSHAVTWFWIPEWDLPSGVESRQESLPFPACNLVVEPDGIILVGPATRRSVRVLTGSGWAIGALLRPAATAALTLRPAELRDASQVLDEPALHKDVVAAMQDHESDPAQRRAQAADRLATWIEERVPVPDPGSNAALANELSDALADPAITRIAELGPRLHTSIRTLQRVADRYFGLSPYTMIRRRRLQEAAERLRSDPQATVAQLASELGYADHAHFTTDFTELLGMPPSRYRGDFRPGATA